MQYPMSYLQNSKHLLQSRRVLQWLAMVSQAAEDPLINMSAIVVRLLKVTFTVRIYYICNYKIKITKLFFMGKQKIYYKRGTVAHACNPSTLRGRSGLKNIYTN